MQKKHVNQIIKSIIPILENTPCNEIYQDFKAKVAKHWDDNNNTLRCWARVGRFFLSAHAQQLKNSTCLYKDFNNYFIKNNLTSYYIQYKYYNHRNTTLTTL